MLYIELHLVQILLPVILFITTSSATSRAITTSILEFKSFRIFSNSFAWLIVLGNPSKINPLLESLLLSVSLIISRIIESETSVPDALLLPVWE